jgi:hypothetical protein
MPRRWLVTLAMFLVATPAAGKLELAHAERKVTTSARLGDPTPVARQLPPTVRLIDDHLVVEAYDPAVPPILASGRSSIGARPRVVRHALGDRFAWFVPAGSRLIVGTLDQARSSTDAVFAIDLATGREVWRRTLHASSAVALAGDRVAVLARGVLVIVDTRTGATLSTVSVALGASVARAAPEPGISYVRATGRGDSLVKAGATLVAVTPRGTIRWAVPAAPRGAVAVTRDTVIDGWIDRDRHRFGIAARDPRDGSPRTSLDLGETSGWYDAARIDVSPDGADDVLVSAVFGMA